MADRHRRDVALIVSSPAPGLTVRQPARGYRWGVDAYLLADFALRVPVATAIDLGTGSGIVALLLAHQGVRVTAVERDPRWLALARANAVGWAVDVVDADVRTWSGAPAELVVANPPWFDPGAGPVSPDPWRAVSRTALHGGPAAFVAAGLRHAPRVCLVGPRVVGAEGAHVARVGRSGRLFVWEVRPGDGPTVEEPVDLAQVYGRFGR